MQIFTIKQNRELFSSFKYKTMFLKGFCIVLTAIYRVLFHHPIKSLTLHYIRNAEFNHQGCIILSTLHYIINTASYHQLCIISSMLHYIVCDALFHQLCIKSSNVRHIISTASYHKCRIISSTLHYIVNSELPCIILSMLH